MVNNQMRILLAIGSLVLIVIAGIVYSVLTAEPPTHKDGKTAVEIVAVPSDSIITIDDQPSSTGTVYLAPGEHTFKASKEGWQEASKKVTIDQAPTSVRLFPIATSEAAREWIRQHPQEELESEGLAAEEANERGLELWEKNPVIDQLPYTGTNFEITYSETDQSPTRVEVLILATDTGGRTAALQQLRSWHYDPSSMYITFVGFENPLKKSGAQ